MTGITLAEEIVKCISNNIWYFQRLEITPTWVSNNSFSVSNNYVD